MHNLGDEVAPQQSESRDTSPDASTQESEDPEAVERRRKARQEILQRGRILDERRRSKRSSQGKASLNDLVDKDGSLKVEEIRAMTTAAESEVEGPGLRNRRVEAQAAALGSALANPFADEMSIESFSPAENETSAMNIRSSPKISIESEEAHSESPPTPRAEAGDQRNDSPLTLLDDKEENLSRSTTRMLPTSPASPPVPPKPAAYRSQSVLIDTDKVSNHPSESLLDLTPTTSTSSAAVNLAELSETSRPSQSDYWSVNEWAEAHAAPFYSPPRSEAAGIEERLSNNTEQSEKDAGEHDSPAGAEDLGFMSDEEAGMSTPSSWTEVGSQISDEY